MQTVISSSSLTSYTTKEKYQVSKKATASKFNQFISWCDDQEEFRMLWLAFTFLGLIGLAVPCALASVITMGDNNFTLWIIICTINVPVLALNLAAQPTRITLPALFLAYLVDFSVIVYCIAYYFMH